MTSMATHPTLLRSGASPQPSSTYTALDNMRTALIYKDINRKDLALILGVSYPTASRMWNRRGGLLVEQLHRVARAVNIPVSEFLTDHGEDRRWIWIKERDDK